MATMQHFWTIQQMFPNATLDNVEIIIYPDGNWEISKWDLPETKPSIDDVESYWNTHEMDYLKAQKKEQLNQHCDATIMGGFTSLALGTSHTYPSMVIDEIWFNSTLHRFSIDPNFTTVNYKTMDSGYLPHTKAQFEQVFIDGHSFGDSQITKLNNLKSRVDAAQTQADLDGIVW